jgi:hypothetical protein
MHASSLRPLPVVLGLGALTLGASGYEGPRTFKSSEVLPASLLRGPHFQVGPEAKTPGYFHEFVLKSDYGPFQVEGRSLLLVRLREVDALSKLDDVSKSEVFLKAAGTSVVNVGKSVGNVVTDPTGTAKGVGGGLKRFGTNLGRKAKRAEGDVADATKKDDTEKADDGRSTEDKAAGAGEAVAMSALGVNAGMRRWAQKVGADPYTTNPVLRKALADVAKVDAAGGLAAKVAVPIPTLVTTTASVGNLVWGQDPEALLKTNEQRLAALGVDKKVAGALFKSKAFTLTYLTVFVDALFAVKAKGTAAYVDAADDAETEHEALFFTESAQMLRAFHAKTPVETILPGLRALVVKTADGRAVALLPVDWIGWTAAFEKAAKGAQARAQKELGAKGFELQLSGRMSDLAKQKATALGWTVKENVAFAGINATGRAGPPGE